MSIYSTIQYSLPTLKIISRKNSFEKIFYSVFGLFVVVGRKEKKYEKNKIKRKWEKPFALIQMKMKENGKTWWGSDFLKYSYIKNCDFNCSVIFWIHLSGFYIVFGDGGKFSILENLAMKLFPLENSRKFKHFRKRKSFECAICW